MENKYTEIMNYIKSLIHNGNLKSGSRLQSIREISSKFSCSKSTVVHALNELEKENIVYAIPQSGYYVVEKNTLKNTAKDIETYKSSLCNENYFNGIENSEIIDFSSASPSLNTFPNRELRLGLNQALKLYEDKLFRYPEIQGLEGLRTAARKHLENSQVFAKEDKIFITSGTQQALYILSRMPFPNGKQNVLIEQPTFFGMIKALQLNKINAVGIKRNKDTLDIEELERIFRSGDIKFFYTIPRFHNPTGYSYTNEQKKQILSLADKYDVYIVEDDYLGDLEMNTKTDPMYSFDLTQRVIYIKSFSKTMMPGIRISMTVVPPLLVNLFREYKSCSDIGTNVLSQGILEILLKSGMYDAHIKRLKSYYNEHMEELRKACSETTLSEFCSVPRTGFFTCIELPSSINARDLTAVLQQKGVYVSGIEEMFLPEYRKSNIIRLSICSVDKQQINCGTQIISETIKNSSLSSVKKANISMENFL